MTMYLTASHDEPGHESDRTRHRSGTQVPCAVLLIGDAPACPEVARALLVEGAHVTLVSSAPSRAHEVRVAITEMMQGCVRRRRLEHVDKASVRLKVRSGAIDTDDHDPGQDESDLVLELGDGSPTGRLSRTRPVSESRFSRPFIGVCSTAEELSQPAGAHLRRTLGS